MEKKIEKGAETEIEDNLGDTAEESTPFTYSISNYGADYPVDGLVKRIKEGTIYVPAFQRGFLWTFKQSSRFIESLLLGLPVPGIFLAKESDTQKLLVIDGQQRLRTLQYFYDGLFEPTKKEFALTGIESKFANATYRSLMDEDRRRLDDTILHATVIKQEEPSNDYSSVYHIFERLNTGGVLLTPQEIRTALYHGEFPKLLSELNQDKAWRMIFGSISKNMRDQELILRFLALYFDGNNYAPPMKAFLNKFMGENKTVPAEVGKKLSKVFLNTIKTIESCIGPRAFVTKKTLNAAIFDAIMVAVATRLETGPITNSEEVKEAHSQLLSNTEFLDKCQTHTADEEKVKGRIRLAKEAIRAVR